MAEMNMAKAINLALHEAMEQDPTVVVMGEDVGQDEGVFRITEGLHAKYGDRRVIDTPLAESGIVGTAIGMAVYGLRPICEIQFSGFDYYNYHQLESHAARFRRRRGILGAGSGLHPVQRRGRRRRRLGRRRQRRSGEGRR